METKRLNELKSAVASFIFDDMLESVCKNAYPLFNKLNIKGCVATWAGKLENNVTLDIEEVEKIKESGWEFLCHGYNSEPLSDSSTDEIINCEIAESKRLFDRYGISVKGYVPSNNVIPSKAIDKVKENYSFMVYAQKRIDNPSDTDVYKLDRISLETLSVNDIKTIIDNAFINKSYMVFYCHNVGEEYPVTVDNLKRIVEYIQKKGIEIKTMSDFLEENSNARIKEDVLKEDKILSNNIIYNSSMINLPNAHGWKIINNTVSKINNVNYVNKVKEFIFASKTEQFVMSQVIPIEFDTVRFIKSENIKFKFTLSHVASKSNGQVRIVIRANTNSDSTIVMDKTYSCYRYIKFIEEDIYICRRDAAITKLQINIYLFSNTVDSQSITIGEPCLQIYNCREYNEKKLFGQLVLVKDQNIVSNNEAVTLSIEKDSIGGLEVKNNLWNCTRTGTYKVEFQVELKGVQDIDSVKLYIGLRKENTVLAMSKYYDSLKSSFSKTLNMISFVNIDKGSNIEFFFTTNTRKPINVIKDNTRIVITQIM